MMISFKIKSYLRNRRWKKYWEKQDSLNHIAFYQNMAQQWREDKAHTGIRTGWD